MKRDSTLFLIILSTFLSCSHKEKDLIVNWESKISESKEINELEEIRDFVFKKLSENNVSKKDFLKAYSAKSIIRTAELLKCSKEEVSRMTDILMKDLKILRREYLNTNEITYTENKLEVFFDHYEEIIPRLKNITERLYKDQQRVGCKYGQYSTCLVLAGYGAAATGGAALLVYAGGSYLCLCSYCSGGWVSWACF
jgi:hypothetical protein